MERHLNLKFMRTSEHREGRPVVKDYESQEEISRILGQIDEKGHYEMDGVRGQVTTFMFEGRGVTLGLSLEEFVNEFKETDHLHLTMTSKYAL